MGTGKMVGLADLAVMDHDLDFCVNSDRTFAAERTSAKKSALQQLRL
jgi:hypothetical protein